ncbi:hypothetical protein BVRB_5g117900 isoform B [Beta vulgaris subsp. vulgaris]|nr:hypothetical protein BVRB_5g117900 isoform B [Beta vulgaris subsp. vulgaris]
MQKLQAKLVATALAMFILFLLTVGSQALNNVEGDGIGKMSVRRGRAAERSLRAGGPWRFPPSPIPNFSKHQEVPSPPPIRNLL